MLAAACPGAAVMMINSAMNADAIKREVRGLRKGSGSVPKVAARWVQLKLHTARPRRHRSLAMLTAMLRRRSTGRRRAWRPALAARAASYAAAGCDTAMAS